MSHSACKWVWKQPLKNLDKFVLLNLADRADDDLRCWPSMKTIANDCGMSVRSVANSIVKLEESKLIFVERRVTPHGKSSNVYTINMTTKSTKRPYAPRAYPDVHRVHIEPDIYLDNIPY
jgi:hypothetical protein